MKVGLSCAFYTLRVLDKYASSTHRCTLSCTQDRAHQRPLMRGIRSTLQGASSGACDSALLHTCLRTQHGNEQCTMHIPDNRATIRPCSWNPNSTFHRSFNRSSCWPSVCTVLSAIGKTLHESLTWTPHRLATRVADEFYTEPDGESWSGTNAWLSDDAISGPTHQTRHAAAQCVMHLLLHRLATRVEGGFYAEPDGESWSGTNAWLSDDAISGPTHQTRHAATQCVMHLPSNRSRGRVVTGFGCRAASRARMVFIDAVVCGAIHEETRLLTNRPWRHPGREGMPHTVGETHERVRTGYCRWLRS